jgi:hypothetical protein
LWALLCAPVFAFAQTDLDVTVVDLLRQKPVPNITVYIENQAIGYSASAQANPQGKIQFKALPLNGAYRVFTRDSDLYSEAASENIVLR